LRRLGYSSQFKKDFKKLSKSGNDIGSFEEAVKALTLGSSLPNNVKDHKLHGQYKNRRELHLKPDLLLIYKISNDYIILERIGSHSELYE